MNNLAVAQITLPPGYIDLGMGNPALDLLPLDLLHKSAKEYFLSGDKRPLQYGAEQGNGYFSSALAGFLTDEYNATVSPDNLFVTAGASSGLDLLCTLYTRPGDVVFVEEPSYFLALRIFDDHGLRVLPIPMDEDGLRIDVLDELLLAQTPKFIYTIPTFQNPSGRTLTKERREALIERAQRHNFLVLADEVYHFLAYAQSPPQAFAAFTQEVEQVISVNSFSKILAPGLRLGWIQAHRSVVKKLAGSGLLDSGGGMNPFTSALVRGMIASGDLRENIAKLRSAYTSRLEAMDAALRMHLPAAEYRLPEGGFFFWVRLPGVDTAALRPKAQQMEVDYRQGILFSSRKGEQDYMRLGFCYYNPEEIEDGIERLANILPKLNRK